MPRLLLATRNAHKTAEISAMLAGFFEVADLHTLPGAPEIEETGVTFAENAAIKALAISRHIGGWALADDSGIEVDALGGEPGVRSARYAGEQATDEENLAKLIAEMEGVADRRAAYACALAYAEPGGTERLFEARCEGRLARAPAGDGGFGYDPIFVAHDSPRENSTMASLSQQEKDAISHRGRAATLLLAWLESRA
jgi:XTP/dITP diphosphohydrolase